MKNRKPYTLEEIRNESLKHTRRIDFKTKNNSMYNVAKRWKILDEMCSHMDVRTSKGGMDANRPPSEIA